MIAETMIKRRLRPLSELAANRPHGDRLKYMAGCRCLPCRAANARYESCRRLKRLQGDWNGFVSPNKARLHLRKLSEKGIGRRTVAEVSGVSETILCLIKRGVRKKIRAGTERKILAVKPHHRKNDLVSAKPVWKTLNRLLREGFAKGELALRLGYKTRNLQVNKSRVTVKTAKRVERFYRMIME